MFSIVIEIIEATILTFIDVSSYWMKNLYFALIEPTINRSMLKRKLQNAKSYREWCNAAIDLDKLEGLEKWKNAPASKFYDFELIQGRLQQFREARETDDFNASLFLLRTSLSRNIGGIGNPLLYGQTTTGTKYLIEEFIHEVITDLNILSIAQFGSLQEKVNFFKNLKRSFGNTALLLSGGATLAFSHMGVLECLFQNGLLPRIISGSSAGSVFAAMLCVHTDDEIEVFFKPENILLDAFGETLEPHESDYLFRSFFKKVQRWFQKGVIMDTEYLKLCLQKNLGDYTFLEAYNRTRRILNVTVSTSTIFDMPRLLNYLTSPDVVIWSAVIASCAIPSVYEAYPLFTKDKNGKLEPWHPTGNTWIDGSVENDLPMTRLSELFNVNHFLVSQVNPHIYPFVGKSLKVTLASRILHGLSFFMNSEILFRLNQLSDFGISSKFLFRMKSVLCQKYEGDITIVPELKFADFFQLLSSPTPMRFEDMKLRGCRATWPKMSIIKNHLLVELTIDNILYKLRCKLLTEAQLSPNSVSQLEREELEMEGNSKLACLRKLRDSRGIVISQSHYSLATLK